MTYAGIFTDGFTQVNILLFSSHLVMLANFFTDSLTLLDVIAIDRLLYLNNNIFGKKKHIPKKRFNKAN